MASEKQIEANRLNAQHCTGPKTVEGKARSSQNAFKTGLHSTAELISGESPEEYAELIADFHRDYAPANAAERTLVDTMIRSEWLNRRFMSVTASIWRRSLKDDFHESLGFVFNMVGDSFVRADRCHNSAQRNFDRALARLIALQSKRGVKNPGIDSAPPDAEPIPTRDETPIPTRNCEGAEPEPSDAAPLNPKLVSFRTFRYPATIDEFDLPEDPPLAA